MRQVVRAEKQQESLLRGVIVSQADSSSIVASLPEGLRRREPRVASHTDPVIVQIL